MEGSSPSAHPAEAFSTNIALLPRPLIVEVWTHKPNHKLTHKDEANAKGADRKTIKTLTIDFKRANQSSRDSRKSTNEPHNNFNVETGFDFIYECISCVSW